MYPDHVDDQRRRRAPHGASWRWNKGRRVRHQDRLPSNRRFRVNYFHVRRDARPIQSATNELGT